MENVQQAFEEFKLQLLHEVREQQTREINSIEERNVARQHQLQEEFRILEEQNSQLKAELEILRSKESLEEDEWIEASTSRQHGNCELPASVAELFNRDSIKNRKDLRCVYKALNEYPRPKG